MAIQVMFIQHAVGSVISYRINFAIQVFLSFAILVVPRAATVLLHYSVLSITRVRALNPSTLWRLSKQPFRCFSLLMRVTCEPWLSENFRVILELTIVISSLRVSLEARKILADIAEPQQPTKKLPRNNILQVRRQSIKRNDIKHEYARSVLSRNPAPTPVVQLFTSQVIIIPQTMQARRDKHAMETDDGIISGVESGQTSIETVTESFFVWLSLPWLF